MSSALRTPQDDRLGCKLQPHQSSSPEPTSKPEENEKTAVTSSQTVQPEPTSPYSSFQWLLICIAVYSSALLYGLDTTIVAVLQGPIIARFNDVDKLGWLGIGFPLGSIATIAPWSKAYGAFDTKWMYISSLVHFAAGSALCGAAPNMDALIVGRVWAGAGGAGMYLGQLNIWTQNTSLERRSWYISGGGVVWSVGCIVGPLIGGAFADSDLTWRWAFYLNLVLFGLFTPVYCFVLNSHVPRPGASLAIRLKEFDWLGIILNAGMYTAFVVSFAIGGTLWPWNDGRTIGTLVAFGLTLLVFIVQQKFTILTTPEHRVFPVQFLTKRSFILLYIAQSSVQTALAVPLYYIPLFFQFARAKSAVTSAIRLLPFIIVNSVVVLSNGFMLPKYGRYMVWYLASGIFNTVGGALFFARMSPRTPTGAIYGYSILLALGTGLAQQTAYSVAAVKAPEHVSDAIGFINSAQVGSVVLALTFTSLIFQSVGYHNIKGALADLDMSGADIRAALGGAKSHILAHLSENQSTQMRVETGIVDALRWSFITVLIAGVLEIGAALCMKREQLFVNATQDEKADVVREGHGK